MKNFFSNTETEMPRNIFFLTFGLFFHRQSQTTMEFSKRAIRMFFFHSLLGSGPLRDNETILNEYCMQY